MGVGAPFHFINSLYTGRVEIHNLLVLLLAKECVIWQPESDSLEVSCPRVQV